MTIPKLLFQKRFLLRTVPFVSLFSIIFILVYNPFSNSTWFSFTSARSLGVTLLFYASAILTLVISKLILCSVQKNRQFQVRQYVLWLCLEFLVIAVEYLGFTVSFSMAGIDFGLLLIGKTCLCVSLILVIPYTIITFYAEAKSRKEELELFKINHKQENLEPKGRLIRFCDNSGKQKMAVVEHSIFYIESQDNYVMIYYNLDGKMASYLLRCSTSKMEEYLEGTSVVRCKRSFLVNTARIVRFRKETRHAVITLDAPSNKEITVTPAYYRTILSHLDKRCL